MVAVSLSVGMFNLLFTYHSPTVSAINTIRNERDNKIIKDAEKTSLTLLISLSPSEYVRKRWIEVVKAPLNIVNIVIKEPIIL